LTTSGKAPAHTSSVYHEIGGLTKADNLVLKESCQYIIENDDAMVNPESLFGDGDKLGFSRSEIKDCIEVLEQNGYLDVSKYLGGGGDNYACHYKVTTYGLDSYAESYISDYSEVLDKAVSLIVNEGANSNAAIQEKLNKPITIINHILNVLESKEHVKLSKTIGGLVHIFNVSASLRRALA
jgi:hypothetical protein